MADGEIFNFKPWGQGEPRPRGRGRAAGWGRCRGRGRARGRAQSRELPFSANKPGHCLVLDLTSASEYHNVPEETPSPGSSSSSKRSCTEIEDTGEAKDGVSLKKHCKKEGSSDAEHVVAMPANSLKQVQDSYMSSESNGAGSPKKRNTAESNKGEEYKVTEKKDLTVQQRFDVGLDCLSNAITENCTCTSDEDLAKVPPKKIEVLSRATKGVSSLSSPNAGCKQRPFLTKKSKSDSWVSEVDCCKRRDKSRRRHRSAAIVECIISTDDDSEPCKQTAVSKGSKMKFRQWGQKNFASKLATSTSKAVADGRGDDKCASEVEESSGMCTYMYESEDFEGDVESSPEGEPNDSLTDEEHWDGVVQKLSAGGVDAEDVPSIQTKMNEIYHNRAEEKVSSTTLQGHSIHRRYSLPSLQNRMDAPLQFRPGFQAQYRPYHMFRPARPYCTAPTHSLAYQRPPMWSMLSDPYNYFGQPVWAGRGQSLSTLYSDPPLVGMPTSTSPLTIHDNTDVADDALPTNEPQNVYSTPECEHSTFHDACESYVTAPQPSLIQGNDCAFDQTDFSEFCSGDSFEDGYQFSECAAPGTYDPGDPDPNIYLAQCNEAPQSKGEEYNCQEPDSTSTDNDYVPPSNIARHHALPTAFIPRQIAFQPSRRQRAVTSRHGTSGLYWQTPLTESPQSPHLLEDDSLQSTEDNSMPYGVKATGKEQEERATSGFRAHKMAKDKPQQNWYEATDTFGSGRRKSKVWGNGVTQTNHELEEQDTPTLTDGNPAAASKHVPPSYAAVLSSSRKSNAMYPSQPASRTSSSSSLSATKSFWQTNTASFEFVSPQGLSQCRRLSAEKGTQLQITPKTSVPAKFRSWSDGAQGWSSYNHVTAIHPESAPTKAKTCSEILQRPRRLTLEDEVRTETIIRAHSWRSSSESEDILEVQYPVSDIDYVDSHCHLDLLYQRYNFKGSFAKFSLTHKFPANFAGCVAIFCYPVNFYSSYSLADDLLKETNIWGSFGCHPHQVKHYDGVMEQRIKDWMSHPKTVALGEIGLDYSDRPRETTSDHDLQREIFRRQLQLALDVKKPLVIHCRDAEEDTLTIMTEMVPRNHKIHRHCFTGPLEDALTFLRAFPNSFIGLTALVTFPTATNTHQTAKAIPLNRLLLETDTPYFVPRKVRGTKWSHPGMAIFVAERVAQLRGIHLDEVLAAVRENTKLMYGI